MKKKYEWLNRRTPRAVHELRPWPENPRLNPDETHITVLDYVEDIISDSADRDAFCDLIKSIAQKGFIPADPIVIWQNLTNNKFYVAEGNRRVLALKILLNPDKAPRSIRAFVRKYASMIDRNKISKIMVNVAPTFEDAEWYINDRNNTSSLRKNWSRTQQQNWILHLYTKYKGDIDKILSITSFSKAQIESIVRISSFRSYVNLPEVKVLLSPEELIEATSYKFPITILERFFNYTKVKEKWGIEYNGVNVIIKSNKNSFYNAFAALIKRIVNEDSEQINTRITSDDIDRILDTLPEVTFDAESNDSEDVFDENEGTNNNTQSDLDESPKNNEPIPPLKNNPNRDRLILEIYEINSNNTKLSSLFNELKRVPLRYNNSIAAAIRVFLDLAVLNYIQTENLENDICAYYRKDLKDVTLSRRIEYIKSNKLNGKSASIAEKLLYSGNQYSLDVLNGYIHSNDTCYSSKQFINSFWDFLFPLFEELIEINEK